MGFRPDRVVAWMVDAPVADDDPLRDVKLRARQLCSTAHMAERSAARLVEAAGMFADSAFDPAETWDAGKAAGLTGQDLDAAAHIAVVLREVELGHGG